MRQWKRIGSLLAAAALCLSLIGCGGGEGKSVNQETGAPAAEPAGQDTAEGNAVPLAAAVYPEQPDLPREEDFYLEDGEFNYEGYDWALQEWIKDRAARPDVSDDAVSLRYFFRVAAEQFLSGTGENCAISPLNIYFALSMLAEVSDGNSRAQLLNLLGAESMEDLRGQSGRICRALYADDGVSSVIPGSSLWLRDDTAYNGETLKTLAENYFASAFAGKMGSKALNEALQNWLNEQTKGLLTEQADAIELTPDTILAIAATLYYKAMWNNQFEPGNTTTEPFHAADGGRDAPFMHETDWMILYRGEGFTAVQKSLSQGGMWLLLPDEGVTPADLLNNSAAMDFFNNPGGHGTPEDTYTALALPKFDVSFSADLCDGLQALGITDVFDAAASDFTPLTEERDDLFVSQIQHAARVKIDEEGCEAAAFTVTMVGTTAAVEQPEPVPFELNRPFLFCVASDDNIPLFVGVVETPLDA